MSTAGVCVSISEGMLVLSWADVLVVGSGSVSVAATDILSLEHSFVDEVDGLGPSEIEKPNLKLFVVDSNMFGAQYELDFRYLLLAGVLLLGTWVIVMACGPTMKSTLNIVYAVLGRYRDVTGCYGDCRLKNV